MYALHILKLNRIVAKMSLKNYLRNLVDTLTAICYIVFSDRVTKTCEARNRGRTYGSLPFYIKE